MNACAILFARYPEPGTVKTRLVPWLTPAGAADLYTAFLRDALHLLRASSANRKMVAFTPAARAREMGGFVDDATLELVPQAAGDLGARMKAALDGAGREGAARTVIVGSDCPTLPVDVVDRALDALATRDVVLGPATDGGYYLVGCAGLAPPEIFSDIAWGTDRVLAATLAALGPRSLGLLEPWPDVDTPADVRWLATHLAALGKAGDGRAPHTAKALGRLAAHNAARLA